ncbi:hypothetical protein G6F57_019404 [Rhizopus arrhizus]|nr:hypothetical protein G6F31_016577 [Rhizopus arrhizus]KAG1439446.1 hypothetical protein G6F57_019404 [Rhizopus arrhizus]
MQNRTSETSCRTVDFRTPIPAKAPAPAQPSRHLTKRISVGKIATARIRATTHARGAQRITQVSRCTSALSRTSSAEHAGYDTPRAP